MPLRSRESDEDRDVLTIVWRLSRPPDVVWGHLTDARRLPEWLGSPGAFQGTAGGEIHIDHGDGYVCRSVVLEVEPAIHRFAVSWEFPDEHATQVDVRLSAPPEDPGAGSSLLTLRHVELADLRDSYAQGWVTHLTFLEASLDGTPLPVGQFWNLHATFGRLDDAAGPHR